MNDSEKIKTRPSLLERYAWALAVAWTVVVAASLIWNVFELKHETSDAARIQARFAYEKDVIYRRWNAQHSLVYVPVTEETQPNPYLSHIPDRDITTPSGKLLTLMNPAYMTRQVHELAEKEQGIHGHITSLNPIRPENSPDPWETKALQAFESGQTEISSVEEMEGKEYMRLMRPLVTEKGCLECHAAQGYQEGDIQGGISISVPMDSLKAIARTPKLTFGLGHVLLWLMGLGGIVLATERLKQKESARRQAAEALEKAKDALEIRGEERTSELKIANEQLREEITQRKQVEEALRANEKSLAEAQRIAHMGNWDLDLVKNELRWSDEIYRIFGLKPQEFRATYEAFLDAVHPDDREFVNKSYTTSLKNNTPYDIVHRIERPDGEVRYVHEKAEDIKDEKGKTIRSIGTVQDITEQKQAEDRIKASLKEKEVLLQEVHHRVKNNMQIISSLFNLQSRHIKDKQALEIFKSSQNRVRSMALIHERFYQSEDMARVDFAEYAQSLTSHLFSSHGISPGAVKLNLKIKDVFLDLNTAIPCGLIINELVSNSLKHAFPGEKKGEIKIAIHPLNKYGMEVIVSDNGVGLPKKVDFRKTDSLGLHLVNLLAEDQLHGDIKLDRTKGTSFCIKFKVKR
jgi:PAS domain S-box-containing protein